MVNFIKPLFLGTEKEFANMYANPIKNGQHKDSNKKDISMMKKRSFVLHKQLCKFVQRKEAELLKSFLPEKFEYVLFIPMSEVQVRLYEHILKGINQREDFKGKNLLTDYTCLRKIWTHPKVLEDAWKNAKNIKFKKDVRKNPANSDDDQPDDIYDSQTGFMSVTNDWWRNLIDEKDLESILPSKKLRTMFEILRLCEEKGDKCLIFSAFVAVLNVVEYFFKKITENDEDTKRELNILQQSKFSFISGKDYYRLDGKTSKSIRHEMIKCFNRPDNLRARIFLISAKAGGQGINLTGANRVIILDTSWNPSNDQQNIFRIFRLGQKKKCYVYRLLAMGTMEEKVYSRSVTKQAMSFRVVDEQQIDRHYSLDELNELYILTIPNYSERPMPVFPQDTILAHLLRTYPELVYKYHEHDSLLENKVEQELSEQEKAEAWAAYERDLQMNAQMREMPNMELQNNFGAGKMPNYFGAYGNLNPQALADYRSLMQQMTNPSAMSSSLYMNSLLNQYNYQSSTQNLEMLNLYRKYQQIAEMNKSLSDGGYGSAAVTSPYGMNATSGAASSMPSTSMGAGMYPGMHVGSSVGNQNLTPLGALSDLSMYGLGSTAGAHNMSSSALAAAVASMAAAQQQQQSMPSASSIYSAPTTSAAPSTAASSSAALLERFGISYDKRAYERMPTYGAPYSSSAGNYPTSNPLGLAGLLDNAVPSSMNSASPSLAVTSAYNQFMSSMGYQQPPRSTPPHSATPSPRHSSTPDHINSFRSTPKPPSIPATPTTSSKMPPQLPLPSAPSPSSGPGIPAVNPRKPENNQSSNNVNNNKNNRSNPDVLPVNIINRAEHVAPINQIPIPNQNPNPNPNPNQNQNQNQNQNRSDVNLLQSNKATKVYGPKTVNDMPKKTPTVSLSTPQTTTTGKNLSTSTTSSLPSGLKITPSTKSSNATSNRPAPSNNNKAIPPTINLVDPPTPAPTRQQEANNMGIRYPATSVGAKNTSFTTPTSTARNMGIVYPAGLNNSSSSRKSSAATITPTNQSATKTYGPPNAPVPVDLLKSNSGMQIIPTTSPPGTASISKQLADMPPSISLTAVRSTNSTNNTINTTNKNKSQVKSSNNNISTATTVNSNNLINKPKTNVTLNKSAIVGGNNNINAKKISNVQATNANANAGANGNTNAHANANRTTNVGPSQQKPSLSVLAKAAATSVAAQMNNLGQQQQQQQQQQQSKSSENTVNRNVNIKKPISNATFTSTSTSGTGAFAQSISKGATIIKPNMSNRTASPMLTPSSPTIQRKIIPTVNSTKSNAGTVAVRSKTATSSSAPANTATSKPTTANNSVNSDLKKTAYPVHLLKNNGSTSLSPVTIRPVKTIASAATSGPMSPGLSSAKLGGLKAAGIKIVPHTKAQSPVNVQQRASPSVSIGGSAFNSRSSSMATITPVRNIGAVNIRPVDSRQRASNNSPALGGNNVIIETSINDKRVAIGAPTKGGGGTTVTKVLLQRKRKADESLSKDPRNSPTMSKRPKDL